MKNRFREIPEFRLSDKNKDLERLSHYENFVVNWPVKPEREFLLCQSSGPLHCSWSDFKSDQTQHLPPQGEGARLL